MNPISPYSNLYMDQYLPAEEPVVGTGLPEGFEEYAGYDDYSSFDEEFEVVGDEGAVAGSEFEIQEDEVFVEEEPAELTAKQKSDMEWLEDHGEDIAKDFYDVQERFADLESGDESPEDKRKRLEEIEGELADIERELKKYNNKEESLLEGASDEQLYDYSAAIEGEDLADELEDLGDEIEEALETAKTEETEAAEEEKKVEEKENKGREVKEKLTDALGYLNGAKDVRYFTAKVWGDKHIKEYHAHVTNYARDILSKLGDAAVSGDWTAAIAAVGALSSGDSDNTLGLIGYILSEHYPEVLDEMPSEVLEAMSDAIHKGNGPDAKAIYYINQDGKYDEPKNDRRRKDMHHVNFAFNEAAVLFSAKADAARTREKAEDEENGDEFEEDIA